jgi:hypothetical protein
MVGYVALIDNNSLPIRIDTSRTISAIDSSTVWQQCMRRRWPAIIGKRFNFKGKELLSPCGLQTAAAEKFLAKYLNVLYQAGGPPDSMKAPGNYG